MRWDSEECRHWSSLYNLPPPGTRCHRWDCLLTRQPMVTSVSRQMETALGAVHFCFNVCILTIYWMSTQEIPMIWDGKQKSELCDRMRIVRLLIVLFGLTKSYPKRKADETRELRAIVPQLLPNYTTSTLPPAHQVRQWTFSGQLSNPFLNRLDVTQPGSPVGTGMDVDPPSSITWQPVTAWCQVTWPCYHHYGPLTVSFQETQLSVTLTAASPSPLSSAPRRERGWCRSDVRSGFNAIPYFL